ncbi:MAG: protocatechuate 3,4-dioxygenase subunit alpha [Acidimicrobiales bacterium]
MPDRQGERSQPIAVGLTPSQTVGPFLHLVLADPTLTFAVPQGTPRGFWVRGTVTDGEGAPVVDALVETWQAAADGTFEESGAGGFGRCPTDADGRWAIFTTKPGPVRDADGRLQAPHLAVSVFARGLLDRVVTRVYFADEERANAEDPVLAMVPVARRGTLLATSAEDGYRFDVRLQGDHETVFFEI